MKYFLVTCLRGHQGRHRSVEISFAFKARHIVEANDKARRMPSVKHDRMNCIVRSREITFEEYIIYRQISAYER